MAYDQPDVIITLEAGADLSASQYRGVKVTGAQTCGVVAASSDVAVGVLVNKPNAAGKAAEIATFGQIVKCEAQTNFNAGAVLMFHTDGRVLTAATAGNRRIGVALQGAGAAGDIVSVYLNDYGPVPA